MNEKLSELDLFLNSGLFFIRSINLLACISIVNLLVDVMMREYIRGKILIKYFAQKGNCSSSLLFSKCISFFG